MYPISDACKAALSRSHARTVVCEAYQGFGSMIASTYSLPRINLEPTGSIRIEYGAKHSRSFTATVIDETGLLVPPNSKAFDPISRPQLQFYFDIDWEDDLGAYTERIPCGRFMIDKCEIVEVGADGVQMNISGNSRSSTSIQDNKWTEPYQMTPGVSWDRAVMLALQDRALDGWRQQFRFETSTSVMPLGVQLMPDESSDPWAELQAMAVSDARELLEDGLGAFIYRKPPNVRLLNEGEAVWSYREIPGSPSHEMGAKRGIDITNAFNGAIVNGTAPWLISPVQGLAWDTNPGSDTYYKGKFGRRAQTFDDETVGDEAQADEVAAQKLATILGVSETVDVESLPNPAHESGDVITVQISSLEIDTMAVLQSVELPFSVEEKMPITVNRVRR